jgi:hypothetical protein
MCVIWSHNYVHYTCWKEPKAGGEAHGTWGDPLALRPALTMKSIGVATEEASSLAHVLKYSGITHAHMRERRTVCHDQVHCRFPTGERVERICTV